MTVRIEVNDMLRYPLGFGLMLFIFVMYKSRQRKGDFPVGK